MLQADPGTGPIVGIQWHRPRGGGWPPVVATAPLATLPEGAGPGEPPLLNESPWRVQGPRGASDWTPPGRIRGQVGLLDDHRPTVCLRLTITGAADGPGRLGGHCFVTDGARSARLASQPGRRG